MTAKAWSERNYAAGPTGSGKSELLLTWAKDHPRIIEIDTTGESAARRPMDGNRPVEWARDKRELRTLMVELAAEPSWRVVIPSGKVEPTDLVNLLAPEYVPGEQSFPQLLGGVCLMIHEGAEVASQAKRYQMSPLWQRGRHHGLSILCASQRAADVGRMVSSQSNRVAIFSTMEPIDLTYWRGFLIERWYEQLQQLPRFHAIEVNRDEQTARIISSRGAVVCSLGGVRA